jgi:hypothetical protein
MTAVRQAPSTAAAPATEPATRTPADSTVAATPSDESPPAQEPNQDSSPGRSRLETLKRYAGYIPEVRMARALYRWVRKQPPPDALPRPNGSSPESR